MRLFRRICGYEVERIPDISFHLMSLLFSIRDVFIPVGKRLDRFGIDRGAVVVDFGCGPGSYIERASQIVGDAGKGYPVDIESRSVDVIYALDMFHHVKDAGGFLRELHRLLKPGGRLFIERGHQPMENAKEKISKSDCWVIRKEDRNMFECIPK